MRFLGIKNCEIEGFGLYETLLRAFWGSPLPAQADYEAILVGGTPVSACATKSHPFLTAQEQYLRSAIQGGKPCLGICFGAQLLAKILGGGVRKAKQKEIGVYELELTAAVKDEPLLQGFPPRFPVFHWHGDTFNLPPGAELLAVGADCRNQMFRCGRAVGVLFHLETTSTEAASWAKAYSDELRLFGKSVKELLSEIRGQEQEIGKLARIFVKNFVSWIKIRGAA
jgi:GMP synthase-like glutamine amidotransferase